ncbi:MAG TPA: TraR/DksA family transcriptional regulator [Ktedonobacterales bacterium]
MAQLDMAAIRHRLESERTRLEAEIYDHTQGNAVVYPMDPVSDSNGISSDQADDADAVENAERMNAITRNSQVLLNQVNAALHRIAEGTYGTCVNCGGEIAPRRLQALPYATLCIECQGKAEHTAQQQPQQRQL